VSVRAKNVAILFLTFTVFIAIISVLTTVGKVLL
jgi:hypothetical protein